MGGVFQGPCALVGRLAGSLHLRTLRPSRRRRRCICSCDLDACLPCCLLVPTFICRLHARDRETSYTGAQCTSHPVRCADPIPLAFAFALELPLLLLCRTRLYRASIPSASVGRLSHQPPATARRLLAIRALRFPEPGRRCLNLISARRSAPIRPKKLASTLYRQSLQEPAYCYAPAALLPQTPSRIQSDGAPICGTDAHDITPVSRFPLSPLPGRPERVCSYHNLDSHALLDFARRESTTLSRNNRKHGRKRWPSSE